MEQRFVLLVLSVFLYGLFQIDSCSGMKIKIEPERFKGDNGKDVNISCTMDSAESAAKEIMLLKISRKGEKAIAIIHPNNSISYVNGNPMEFPAMGSINKNIQKSYLTLSITDPMPEDSGAYSCNIFYIDEMGSLVEGKASGYLAVDDPELKSLKDTMKDMVIKVNKGEKLFAQYKPLVEQYKNKVDDLERQSSLQAKQISNILKDIQSGGSSPQANDNQTDSMFDILTDLLNREAYYKDAVTKLVASVNVQDKKIANLLTRETTYVTKISAMESQFNIQSKQIANLMQTVNQFSSKITTVENASKKTSSSVTNLVQSNAALDAKVVAATLKANYVSSKLANLKTKSNPIIAFSVTNQYKFLQAKTGSTLIFPDVILQEGQGYDPKTGVFTAPADGLYAFHLVLKLSCTGCSARVQLIADLQVLAKLKIGMTNDEHQGSLSAVIKLTKGAEVFNSVDFATNRALLTMSQLCVFTGYLVNAA